MIDTTELVIDILNDALDIPISTQIPMTRPERLVLVSLLSDDSDIFILTPTYGFTCWGTSDIDARNIGVSVLHALAEAAETHDYLSHVELENMTRDEWTNTGQARYVLTLRLTINTDE